MRLRALVLGLSLFAPHQGLCAPPADPSARNFVLKDAPEPTRESVDKHRVDFLGFGYRFDEDAGTILSPDTKKPVSVAEVDGVLNSIRLGYKHQVLERMHH